MAANGTGSLVSIDDVTADRSSRMNSEVYRSVPSVQTQPNVSSVKGRCLIVQRDNDVKHRAKPSQELLKAKN